MVNFMKANMIFYQEGYDSESINFRKFAKEIENRINSDQNILKSAEEVNNEFFEKLKKLTEDESNTLYSGASAIEFLNDTPRYEYIKNLEDNGKKYEAEIDLLGRRFHFIEI